MNVIDNKTRKVIQAFQQLEWDCNGFTRPSVYRELKALRQALEELVGYEIAELN